MKLTKIVFCTALLGVAVFAASVASAVPGYFTVSGTATTDTPTTTGTKFEKHSFATKDVLTILANATGQFWISNKNSHLLYDPDVTNTAASAWYGKTVWGIFWATNTTSHNYYRLDNPSTLSGYWSYIELDYYGWSVGFWDPYQIVGDTPVGENYAYSEVETLTKDSFKEVGSDAILYVHGDPTDFDYLDFGGNVLFDLNNTNAFVIRGPISLSWSITASHTSESITLKGAGDGMLAGYGQPVMTGEATYSGKD